MADQEKRAESIKVESRSYSFHVLLDYFNERLRVEDYLGNPQHIIEKLQRLSEKHSLKKLIMYARPAHLPVFLHEGFSFEAVLKGYFRGTDAYAMALFTDPERRNSPFWIKEDRILADVKQKGRTPEEKPAADVTFRNAEPEDAEQLAALYGEIFKIYPTPVTNPAYIRKGMENGTIFYIGETDGRIISAASADVNRNYFNAELTDCATLPEYRKGGLIKQLLEQLEGELKKQGIFCAYSIARALSFGMNAAFYQLGYHYGGRLANNCYIYDKIEDMNVWVKDLAE
ncbi:putative beta-lysine N-acetyltransferase [Bacillus marinisedimentorum]|uniref:putative beta-lysine N-acetyltransferase n=1 Tax=Bacillus marinisedimentorum TaxID=1821260 RepID=UPI00087248F9|nr:putative beta-lysine N-acetyltransferase [Bacillus marinisedimentorum]